LARGALASWIAITIASKSTAKRLLACFIRRLRQGPMDPSERPLQVMCIQSAHNHEPSQ
jgi:hypothetical protein